MKLCSDKTSMITAALILSTLAAPLVMAESRGEEDVQKGTPEHQHENEEVSSHKDLDAHKQGQTEREGACGAAD